jgi:hypothetical protein
MFLKWDKYIPQSGTYKSKYHLCVSSTRKVALHKQKEKYPSVLAILTMGTTGQPVST